MKLIDQYIYAINKKLPYDSRKEITLELKSLLLDDLESKYGDTPTDEQIKELIKSYGSPSTLANQYNPHRSIIGTGFTDLYYFIAKMIFLGLSIALLITYIINLFNNGFSLDTFAFGFVKILMNLGSTMISAIGLLTIIFIVLTRLYKEEIVDLDENWTPDDLKDIQISPKVNSLFESIFTIVFTSIALILLNAVPYLISLGEKSFEFSGLTLGHYIDIDRFKFYLIFVSIAWISQIIFHILLLFHGRKTKNISIFEIIVEGFNFLLLVTMVQDMSLYTNYNSPLGFRALFLLIAVISFFELFSLVYKYVKYFVLKD